MNKKFSTLLTAGLLVGGASLFNVDAKVVTPKEFLAAIENNVLNVEKLELPEGDLKVELSGNVDITKNNATKDGHLFIKTKGLTITEASGKQVTFTGRFAINADDVTINGLNIKHHVSVNSGSYWKTAITVVGKSATITGNTIVCSADNGKLANGITIFPTAADAEYNVSGNTIKNSNSSEGQWTSAAIQVAEGATNPNSETSKVLDDFDVTSISDNTFEDCAADYIYSDRTSGSSVYKAAQVTPIEAKDGTITNADFVAALVTNSKDGEGMIFNGTAEQLAKALKAESVTTTVAIETNDGPIIAGVAQLQPTITLGNDEVYNLVEELPSTDEYFGGRPPGCFPVATLTTSLFFSSLRGISTRVVITPVIAPDLGGKGVHATSVCPCTWRGTPDLHRIHLPFGRDAA